MTDSSAKPSTPGGRTVLITGTSSGIGLATAISAAKAGWTTIATMRDLRKDTALRQAADTAAVVLDVRALDVTDPVSIAACVGGVTTDHGQLDALINNAGAAHVGTLETADMADIRACLEVNFFGVVQLSQVALPLLRISRGRLITVTSVGGVVGQPFNEAYCAAKFAVEGFMESLAPVAASVGVAVCVIEPGAVRSEFINNLGADPAALIAGSGPYAGALGGYLNRVGSQFSTHAQSAADVGNVIAGALIADPLPFRIQTSEGARKFVGVKLADLDGSAVQRLTTSWLAESD